ncbi:MAG TPA: hypothetical protein VEN81_11865 [Planctomycetota bacterium]|nr:hypothetical protein [Planctomycetota bacterium]
MTKALSWVAGAGSTTREVAIFVQYTPILDINPVTVKRPPQQGQEVKEGRSTTRSGENTLENENRSNMMLLAIAAPRKATDSAAPFPPELDSNTFNVLTSVRRNSPNYRKIEATIEGVPHWWILSPGWIVGTPDLNPTTFLAELYSADPDTGATPLDAAVIARRNGTAPWQPTGGYLFRGDRLMRATAVLENGLPARVDAVDVPEPPVEDFLISKEVSIPCARQRTGVLLAAKNRTLPKMIREGTTSSLADLATRVEKTILDLNYNREQTNSLAQQAIESGGKAGGLPELSLAYKERIEVLKPMVAAIKEELANRGK